MIQSYTSVGDDSALPTTPLNLSARMRELRSRQGLKQSEIARRMGLDPSIPSLWEQGKRLVPASRVTALADALGVSLSELLDGMPGTGSADPAGRETVVDYTARAMHALRDAPRIVDRSPYLSLLSTSSPLANRVIEEEVEEPAPVVREPFVPAPRPVLTGWIPEGWEPGDRVQDIAPTLPEGFWLDPVRLERPAARELLRSRLCAADQQQLVGDQEVPGAALAERLYKHCCKEEGFLTARVPLVETIFRSVLAADYAGLPVDTLVEQLHERPSTVAVTTAVLRRLRDSLRPYPMRWVDANLT
jgi:transcriptional regulator with XRE-family HTH domain